MKPQKIYAEVLEPKALEQFNEAMAQHCTVQGALMPDAHTGYTLPIGAVIATDGKVFPSYVGYDIGCGMAAQGLGVSAQAVRDNAHLIMNEIYFDLPVGNARHQTDQYLPTSLAVTDLTEAGQAIYKKRNGALQIGTLGGGNHFVEIGADEADNIWIIVHSGSRGFGHGIAGHYMSLASPTGKQSEGHYGLDVDSQDGKDYINDQNWALKYALWNRRCIIETVIRAIAKVIDDGSIVPEQFINRNHNHVELKDGLWIHRKGATHAEEGMMGVIPGNMRDGSFIVRGKGNPDSMCSSSHGAGRVLGRKAAKEKLSQEEFEQAMEGITAKTDERLIDESPMAYKDIFEVMRLQEDLVTVLAHVKPIINIKG